MIGAVRELSESVRFQANAFWERLEPIRPFLTVVGACTAAYAVGKFSWSLIRGYSCYFLADPFALGTNFRNLTSGSGWAVVTGASDGLGLAFAKELAKRGADVLLVGRNAARLDMVAREIEAQYRVRADILVIDFRHATSEDYARINERLRRTKVDVLVNNVGMASGSSSPFGTHSNTEQLCSDLIHVNILSMLMFTSFVVSGMKKRRQGVIINVSSVAAVYPLPNHALYGATKAFVDFFSRALDLECRPFNVFVMCVLPGPVQTNMTRNMQKSMFLVQAVPFARDTIAQVGLRHRTFGHWLHALMITLAQPIPLWLMIRLIRTKLLQK